MIDCAFCGRSNTPDSLYCIDCGKPVGGAENSSSAEGQPPTITSSAAEVQPPTVIAPVVSARAPHQHRLSPSIGRRASSAARSLDLSLTPIAHATVGSTVSCGWCGSEIQAGLPFCAHCGRRTDAQLTTAEACTTCGSAIRPDIDTFCATCGKSLGIEPMAEEKSKTLKFSARRHDARTRLAVLDERGEPKRTVSMEEPELTVGRGASDLQFEDDQYLSPIHARFTLRDNTLFVRDLGSCNRTWAFIDAAYELADTDVMLIGSQIIEFQRLGSPAVQRPDLDGTRRVGSLTPGSDVARLSQLRADGSVRDSQYLALGRAIIIGRDGGDWTFPYDQTMSGRHAELREADGQFTITDLGSRNGVGIAVRGERALKIGQRILLGDQVLRVESV